MEGVEYLCRILAGYLLIQKYVESSGVKVRKTANVKHFAIDNDPLRCVSLRHETLRPVRVPGRLSYYAVTARSVRKFRRCQIKYLSHFLSREYL